MNVFYHGLLACCLCWFHLSAWAEELPPVAAKAWVIYDYQSQSLLAAKNADQAMEPASLTKLMTAYLVFEALKNGEVQLEKRPAFSLNAAKATGARLPITPQDTPSVDELLQRA